MSKDTTEPNKNAKNKFKREKSRVLTILNPQKKEVGAVRVTPDSISWRVAGATQWHRLSIKDFANLAIQNGVTREVD